ISTATRGSVISESLTSSAVLSERSSSTCSRVNPGGGGACSCAPFCRSRTNCASTSSLSCWSRITIIGALPRPIDCPLPSEAKLLRGAREVNRESGFFGALGESPRASARSAHATELQKHDRQHHSRQQRREKRTPP